MSAQAKKREEKNLAPWFQDENNSVLFIVLYLYPSYSTALNVCTYVTRTQALARAYLSRVYCIYFPFLFFPQILKMCEIFALCV